MTPRVPPFLFPLTLHTDVVAFSTQRAGGVSRGEYSSFNVCHYNGDDPHHVATNRAALAQYLQIPAGHILLPRQTHSTTVRIVTGGETAEQLDGVDAVVTSTAGLCIGVSTADCIPLLLYDARQHIAAAVHAGWRGTLGRIVAHTIETMQTHFGTQPADLYAAIGPGISGEAYDVGEELPQQFAEAGFPIEDIAYKTNKRWHLDLPKANRLELLRLGLAADKVSDCNICTYQHNDRFFSARRQGIHSGRIYTAICRRP